MPGLERVDRSDGSGYVWEQVNQVFVATDEDTNEVLVGFTLEELQQKRPAVPRVTPEKTDG